MKDWIESGSVVDNKRQDVIHPVYERYYYSICRFKDEKSSCSAKKVKCDANVAKKQDLCPMYADFPNLESLPSLSKAEEELLKRGPFAQLRTAQYKTNVALSGPMQVALKGPYPSSRWNQVKQELAFQSLWQRVTESCPLFLHERHLKEWRAKKLSPELFRLNDDLVWRMRLISSVPSDEWKIIAKSTALSPSPVPVVDRESCGTVIGRYVDESVLARSQVGRQLLMIWFARLLCNCGDNNIWNMIFEKVSDDMMLIHPIDNEDVRRYDNFPDGSIAELLTQAESGSLDWRFIALSSKDKKLRESQFAQMEKGMCEAIRQDPNLLKSLESVIDQLPLGHYGALSVRRARLLLVIWKRKWQKC